MTSAPSLRVDKLPAERRALMLELLRERGAVAITALAEMLNASTSTVRRDLDYLTEHGYIERTHGGAVMRSSPTARFEPEQEIAEKTARELKLAIGALAAERVQAGQSAILDAGSTVRAVAQALVRSGKSLTVVTNDLRIAVEMINATSIHAIVSGGAIRPNTSALIGAPGDNFLSGIHADIAFIGVHAIAAGKCTETSLDVAAMKRAMLSAARKRIVLADSTKFGLPTFCEICALSEVDEVITDDGIDPEIVKEIENGGTRVTLARINSRE